MTDSSSTARPPQVTMAGWIAMVGSVFVVFGLFDTVANLRSLETRERVEQLLDEPPLKGTGITLDTWLSVLHVVSLVGAACAVTAAILGLYVLRQSTSARIGLSVVAVPLFLTGFLTAGFPATLVAVSVLMLWTRPARDWFAGRPWLPARIPSTRRDLEDPSSPQPPTPTRPPWEAAPPPTAPGHHAGVALAPPQPRPVVPAGRPPALVAACVLTWAGAGLVALGCVMGLTSVLFFSGMVEDQMREQGLGDVSWQEARRALLGAMALFGVWSLAAMALALFVFLGREWARLLLVASASSAAVLLLLSALVNGLAGALLAVPLLACGTAVVLLLRAEVRGWVRATGTR